MQQFYCASPGCGAPIPRPILDPTQRSPLAVYLSQFCPACAERELADDGRAFYPYYWPQPQPPAPTHPTQRGEAWFARPGGSGGFDRTWGRIGAEAEATFITAAVTLCDRCQTEPAAPGKRLCLACDWACWTWAIQDTIETPTVPLDADYGDEAGAEVATQPALPAMPGLPALPSPVVNEQGEPTAVAPVPWTKDELDGLLRMSKRVTDGAQSDYETFGERAYYSVRGYANHHEVRVRAGNRRWFSKTDVCEALERAFRAGGL